MAIQAGTCKHAVLAGCSTSPKCFETGVDGAGVLRRVVAALAEKRRLSVQELPMIAPMGHVACKAILLDRRMFPEEGPALFGVAFETEFIYGIRLDHLCREAPVLVMALRTFHETLFQRMVGLLVLLGSDVQVTAVAECGLLGLEVPLNSRVNGMASVAGNVIDLVSAQVPQGQCPRFLVTVKASA